MHTKAKRALAWPLVSALAAIGATTAIADGHSLTISAAAPTVTIEPRSTRLNSLRLPSLEYVFDVRPHCADAFDAGSVSLTVADSRGTLPADDLERGVASELRLTVPSSQIAPVPLSGFCIASETAETPAESATENPVSLTIPDILSASASLLCVSETEQSMTYASTSLDIELVCDAGGDADE